MLKIFAALPAVTLTALTLLAQVQPPIIPSSENPIAQQNIVLPSDFGVISSAASASSKSSQKAILAPGVNQPPIVSETRLSNISGTSVRLSLMVNDWNTSRDIDTVLILIWDVVTAKNSCFIQYRLDQDVYQLANDNADAWLTTGVKTGSPQQQRNSQCMLDVSRMEYLTASSGLSSVYVDIRMQFMGGFSGNKRIYTFAKDRSGADSGWVDQAGFQVTSSNSPQIGPNGNIAFGSDEATPLVHVSVPMQMSSGVENLSNTLLIINNAFSSANSCFIEVDLPQQRLRLANDAGSDWLGWVPFDQASRNSFAANPANTQCTILRTGTYFSRSASSPTHGELRLSLIWRGALGTPLRGLANTSDFSGRSSGWVEIAPAINFPAPFRGTLTMPEIATPSYQNFIGDSQNMWAGIGSREALPLLAYHLVGSLDSPTLSCLAEYNSQTRSFRLATQDRTAWLPTTAGLGSDVILDNGSCTLVAKRGSAALAASARYPGMQQLEVMFPLTLRGLLTVQSDSTIRSNGGIHQMVVDERGLRSVWTSRSGIGGFPLLNAGQRDAVQIQPVIAINDSYQFRLDVLQIANPTKPVRVMLNLSPNKAIANSCQLEFVYEASQTRVRLLNDMGTAYSTNYLGQSGIAEIANNQCIVSNAVTSLSLTTYVSFFVMIRLKAGYQAPAAVHASIDSQLSPRVWNSRGLSVVPTGGMEVLTMSPYTSVGTAANVRLQVHHLRSAAYLDKVRVQIGSSLNDPANCIAEISASSRQATVSGRASSLPCGMKLDSPPDVPIDEQAWVNSGLEDIAFSMYMTLPANITSGTRRIVYVEATDRAGNTTGWRETAVLLPPTASGITLSVQPFRQNTTSRTESREVGEIFPRIRIGRQQEPQRLRNVYLLIDSSLSNQGGCLVWISIPQKEVRLSNASRTDWLPGVLSMPVRNSTPNDQFAPLNQRLGNGSCFMLPDGNSFFQLGNEFTLDLYMGFLANMAGKKSAYIFADDNTGQSTGWLPLWNMVVPTAQPPVSVNLTLLPPPTDLSAGGRTLNFNSWHSDPNGGHDFSRISLALGNGPNDANACRWEIDVQENRRALYDDAGVLGPWQSMRLVSPALPALKNRLCELPASRSNVVRIDNSLFNAFQVGLDLRQSVRLLNMPDDTYSLYSRVTDTAGVVWPWEVIASHSNRTLAPFVYHNRTLSGIPLPVSANGQTYEFPFDVSVPPTVDNLQTVYFIFRDGANTANACFVGYEPKTGILRLANDAGNAWLPTVQANGGAGVLSNSQCTVSLLPQVSAGTIIANFYPRVAFKNTFTGLKTYEIYAEADDGTNSGWHIYDLLRITP